MHGNSSRGLRRICKPALQDVAPPPKRDDLPDAPEIDEETDIAQLKTLPGDNSYAQRSGPTGAVPPLALAPRNLAAPPGVLRPPGVIRADGAFDPNGDADDTTSKISPRR